MTPIEFALWLNGAMEITGDQPPTSTQLDLIRAKLTETVGGIVASQLLKRAEHLSTREEEERYTLKQHLAQANPKGPFNPHHIIGGMAKHRAYATTNTILDNASLSALAAAQASYGSKISLNPLQHEDSR